MFMFLVIFGIALMGALIVALIPRLAAGPSAPSETLTTSELKGLIDQAVREATAPLQERLTELEARVETPRLPPPDASPPEPDVPGEAG